MTSTATENRRLLHRQRLAAMLIALPAIVAALGVGILEGRAIVRDEPSQALSFTDAVRADALAEALQYVRSGQDPNKAVSYRDDQVTGDRTVLVTPLLIAVAHNRENMVMLLMSFGARLDAPGNAYAVCLANRLGNERLGQMILRDAGLDASPADCPEPDPAASAPLLAFSATPP
jgi:hypothetical protein